MQIGLVQAAEDRDARVAEGVCDLGFAEAGGVVFEREMSLGVVEMEAAKAIGVGEFSERAKLVVGQGRLEFEFGFEECHRGIIAKRGWSRTEGELT